MITERVPALTLNRHIRDGMERKHSLVLHHQRNRFDICDYQVHPNVALIKVYEHDSIKKKEDKAKGVVEREVKRLTFIGPH